MDIKVYSLAAIRLIVDEYDFYEIILRNNMENDDFFNYTLENFEEILISNKNIITEHQKYAILAYGYLYCALQKNNWNNLEKLRKIFEVSNFFYDICKKVFNEKALCFIKKNLISKNMKVYQVFIEVDNHIVEMINSIVSYNIPKEKKVLKGLIPSLYEHPLDKKTLEILNETKAIQPLVKIYIDYGFEKIEKIYHTGSNILVTKNNIPYLYNALEKVCEVLDISPIPKLYIESGFINAKTIGANEPIIVISSASISLLSYDELLFILGHEVGHIKSQHVLYHTIGNLLPSLVKYLPGGEVLSTGINVALYNWIRKSELTADRVGLLACQNIDAAIRVMMKLSGYPLQYYNNINTKEFLSQANMFKDLDNDFTNKIMKTLSVLYKDHPWTVMRAKELNEWYLQGNYNELIERKDRISKNKIRLRIRTNR